MYWQPYIRTIGTIGSCVMLAACEAITALDMHLDAGRPIDPACISNLESALGPLEGFHKARQQGPRALEEVQIERGGGTVGVNREGPSSHVINVTVMWKGPSDERRERDTVLLLSDVRNAILRVCGVDEKTARVSGRCGGSLCDQPEIEALISNPPADAAAKN